MISLVSAVPAADFIMQDPMLGGKPTEATEVRILFNSDHLYMGVTCYDSEPDKLLGNTRKRDEQEIGRSRDQQIKRSPDKSKGHPLNRSKGGI